MGELVDKIRQDEHRQLPLVSGMAVFNDKITSQCWTLKKMAKDIWSKPWSEERQNDWQRWLALASSSDVPMMTNAAKKIDKSLFRILNAMLHNVSKNKIQTIHEQGTLQTGSYVPLWEAQYGMLSLPLYSGETRKRIVITFIFELTITVGGTFLTWYRVAETDLNKTASDTQKRILRFLDHYDQYVHELGCKCS